MPFMTHKTGLKLDTKDCFHDTFLKRPKETLSSDIISVTEPNKLDFSNIQSIF